MIKNNFFFLNRLNNVCFLGQSNIMDQLVKINSTFKINSLVITSPDQKKKNKQNQIVFKKIDKRFKKFVSTKFNIYETLFISLGARWIFKKQDIEKFFIKHWKNRIMIVFIICW